MTGTGVQNSAVFAGGAFATLELYTGGKRKGQLHIANAEARAAVAQAKAVCDAVAYETNVAYRGIEDARERIVQARTALSQARESFRLMSNRLKTGDAIPAELIGAQTTLTRTQQGYNTAFYDYQVAVARLEFATGAPIARRGGEVPPEAPEGSLPAPPPEASPSPFQPGAEGRGRGSTPRLPSILPPTGLTPFPSPFDEGGPFAPSRPRSPAPPSLDGPCPDASDQHPAGPGPAALRDEPARDATASRFRPLRVITESTRQEGPAGLVAKPRRDAKPLMLNRWLMGRKRCWTIAASVGWASPTS